MKKRIAIVVATVHGQTEKIGERIREDLIEAGADVDLMCIRMDGNHLRPPLPMYDAIIIGGPVYKERYPRPLVRWLRNNLSTLNRRPTAFFSVSLNAADDSPRARAESARILAKFTEDTQFHPGQIGQLIGAVKYTQYGWLTRWMLKRICAKHGGPTDTTRDHELTDWSAVDRFARDFADLHLRTRSTTPLLIAPKEEPTESYVSLHGYAV